MIPTLVLLLAAYLIAAFLGGIGGVLLLAAIGLLGCAVMFGADALHEWRAKLHERRTVYRRWQAWEFQDWLRRHTDWRRP